ncbi:MAG: tetratricopeptide repeat protein, partial [Thermomonas sp.]|nr:tetratricopeptide repeat protein [Thermomonas sp.]
DGLGFVDGRRLPALSPLRANLLWVKAMNGHAIGKLSVADTEALLRQAIAIHEKTIGAGGAQLGEFHSTLGTVLQTSGRLPEALVAHERSAELSRAAGARPIDQAITQYNIGYLYRDYGDYEKSLAAHRRSLAIFDAAGIDRDHIERRRAEKWYALAQIQSGRAADAREQLLRLQQRARALDGEESVEYLDVVWQLLRAAVVMGDRANGEPLLADARARAARFVPPAHPVFTEFLRDEAQFARLQGDLAGAERLQREALKRSDAIGNPTEPSIVRVELADLLVQRGQDAEARILLLQALPVLRKYMHARHATRARSEVLARRLGV